MGLPPAHCVVLDGIQIIVETIIGHQTIVVIFKIEFDLHGLMHSVLDSFPHYLFRNNFFRLYQLASSTI